MSVIVPKEWAAHDGDGGEETFTDQLPGGPGGQDGDMEQRVAAVEKRMDRVAETVARIEGEVSRLPGYGGIALIIGLIVGLSTLAQIGAQFIP